MTHSQLNAATDFRPDPFRVARTEATQARHDFANPDRRPPLSASSPNKPASLAPPSSTGCSRPTILTWNRNSLLFWKVPSATASSFVSSWPCTWLHLAGPAGIRLRSRFLELTQLVRFVAASFGSQ